MTKRNKLSRRGPFCDYVGGLWDYSQVDTGRDRPPSGRAPGSHRALRTSNHCFLPSKNTQHSKHANSEEGCI